MVYKVGNTPDLGRSSEEIQTIRRVPRDPSHNVMKTRQPPAPSVTMTALCCLALLSAPSSARPRGSSPGLLGEPCPSRVQIGPPEFRASPGGNGAGLELRTAGKTWIMGRPAVGREAGAAALLFDRSLAGSEEDEDTPCAAALGQGRFDDEVLASLVTGLGSYRRNGGFRFRFGK